MFPTALIGHSLKARITVATLAIFVISLWSLSFYGSQVLREDMEHMVGEQQLSTTTTLAAQITSELDGRFRALDEVAKLVAPLMRNTTAAQALLGHQPILQLLFNGGAMVLAMEGTAIADVPATTGRVGVNYANDEWVSQALKDGRSMTSRPLMGKVLHSPVFSMTVPIRDSRDNVVGALSAVVNLGKPNFLDKISENRYGKTGGYTLVDARHKLFVTGTDKRLPARPFPAHGMNPLLDQYVQGFEGFGKTVDTFGVEVLSAAKQIPAAGWVLVARVPTEEAFAPIRIMQKHMLLATALLTLLAGSLTWWILRRQLAPMTAAAKTLASMSDTNQPPQPLPVARHDEIGDLIGGFNRLLTIVAQREAALAKSDFRFRSLTELSSDYYWETNAQHQLVQRAESHGGTPASVFNRESPIGKRRWEMPYVSPDEAGWHAHQATLDAHLPFRDFMFSRLAADGTERYLSISGDPLFDTAGNFEGYLGVGTDVTERKQMEEQVRQMAFYDTLTSLPNRRLLSDRLSQTMAASKRNGCYGALMFLDLDNFKSLNDTHGHKVGDLLLIQTADRLKNCVRETDTVARFGGDEYVVVIGELCFDKSESTAQARIVAEKIRDALAKPYVITVQHEASTETTVEHQCTVSIGVALFMKDEANQDDLLKFADTAMYQAKQAGRNLIRFYDSKEIPS